jgi:ribosome-binding ATPase YchF (GTP1/OBG family)
MQGIILKREKIFIRLVWTKKKSRSCRPFLLTDKPVLYVANVDEAACIPAINIPKAKGRAKTGRRRSDRDVQQY